MNKKVIAGIIAAICLAVPFGVSAANNTSNNAKKDNSHQRIDISKLTDQQKADLKTQMEKMIQLRKETVQKMVDNGSITKEQGDKMTKKLDERLKLIQEGKLEFGKGNGFNTRKKGMNVHKKEQASNQNAAPGSAQ